jgi:uncharacterized membrane protein YphA (DoxX/SURF4 family)
MNFMNSSGRRLFLLGIRIFFGIWLLYAGVMKWFFFGSTKFVGFIAADFDKTWSPHPLNVFLAWVILFAEPILSLLILLGKKERLVWALTTLFMFMLVLGQSILMKPDVIANWQYLVLTLTCAALSEPESSA